MSENSLCNPDLWLIQIFYMEQFGTWQFMAVHARSKFLDRKSMVINIANGKRNAY